MHSEYNDIWLGIVEADLPNATKSVGMELSQWADRENGQVNLSMALFLTICGGENEQAAKRHLTRLKQAGIIHFSTCGTGELNIFITFLQWHLIPEEELGLDRALRRIEVVDLEEDGTRRTRMDADLEGMTESSRKGSVQPSHPDQRPDPFLDDGRGMLAPHAGPDPAAMLLAQIETLQSQVGELQRTIGLLCQRMGVQAEVKEEMRSGARVGFGALGALNDDDAPEMARPRAKRGAKRRGFRREEVQQTEVCLFVRTSGGKRTKTYGYEKSRVRRRALR